MKRATLNGWVDAVAFVALVLLVATGVLLDWTLPPGSGHRVTVFGLDRHQWGDLHLWIAISFCAALSVHLALHWRFAAGALRGSSREGSGKRLLLGLLGLAALVALLLAPLTVPVERSAGGTGGRGRPPWAQPPP